MNNHEARKMPEAAVDVRRKYPQFASLEAAEVFATAARTLGDSNAYATTLSSVQMTSASTPIVVNLREETVEKLTGMSRYGVAILAVVEISDHAWPFGISEVDGQRAFVTYDSERSYVMEGDATDLDPIAALRAKYGNECVTPFAVVNPFQDGKLSHANTVPLNVRDLTDLALDWAVATCERLPIVRDPMGFKSGSEAGYWIWDETPKGEMTKIGRGGYTPSTDWSQGGLILDRERPHLCPIELNGLPAYEAWYDCKRDDRHYGETALIAALRCYVASKLGEIVDVPAFLVKHVATEQARRIPSPCL